MIVSSVSVFIHMTFGYYADVCNQLCLSACHLSTLQVNNVCQFVICPPYKSITLTLDRTGQLQPTSCIPAVLISTTDLYHCICVYISFSDHDLGQGLLDQQKVKWQVCWFSGLLQYWSGRNLMWYWSSSTWRCWYYVRVRIVFLTEGK